MKQTKKLQLKKEMVANLNEEQLKEVKGGYITDGFQSACCYTNWCYQYTQNCGSYYPIGSPYA